MMPDATGRGRMIEMEGDIVRRVEGIDKLILKELHERRSYEWTTLLTVKRVLKGKVIVSEEE